METEGDSETSIVPAADANKELQPAKNVDSVSSNTVSSREVKEEGLTAQEKEKKRRDPMQRLKTTIVVSAVIVAVAGAAFAITRKLRQK